MEGANSTKCFTPPMPKAAQVNKKEEMRKRSVTQINEVLTYMFVSKYIYILYIYIYVYVKISIHICEKILRVVSDIYLRTQRCKNFIWKNFCCGKTFFMFAVLWMLSWCVM